MICNSCNTSLTGTPKFCPKCGENVVSEQPRQEVTKKCPQCGAENPTVARFCKVDGFRFDSNALEASFATSPTPIAQPTVAAPESLRSATIAASSPPPAAILLCPRCGTQNVANAKFCKIDGVPLSEAAPTEAVREVAPPPPKPVKERIFAQASQPVSDDFSLKLASSKSKIAIIAGAVAALVTAGGGYWYFNKQDTQEAVAVAPSTESATIAQPEKASEPEVLTPETLKVNLNKALTDAGLSKVGATVDEDFDVELSGEVVNDQEKVKAYKVVKSVEGVAYLTNNILGPNDDPDAPWKPEDIAHMVNKEIAKSVGAGKTRAPLSPEELSVLRQTKGADKPETQNQEAYEALIKAMKNVKKPLSQEKIQEILNAHPALASVDATPAQETQASESSPSVAKSIDGPSDKVGNVSLEPVQKPVTVKPPPKKTEQAQVKKAKKTKSESLDEPTPIDVPKPAAPVPQSPPAEQKPAEQSAPSAEQPKKRHGLRGLIENATGVDPGAASGASQHECTLAEKSMHINGC